MNNIELAISTDFMGVTGVMNGKETISILPLKCSRSENGWTNAVYREKPFTLQKEAGKM